MRFYKYKKDSTYSVEYSNKLYGVDYEIQESRNTISIAHIIKDETDE